VGGFVDFINRPNGRRFVGGGLGMRETSIELVKEMFASNADWGDLSKDWTFQIEIYDQRRGRDQQAGPGAGYKIWKPGDKLGPPDEHYFNFWFVVAPKERDLYTRYRPRKKDWEDHQRIMPIWTFKDKDTQVLVDVYKEDPWPKQALRKNPKEHKECFYDIAWWMAMRDFAQWLRKRIKSSSLGGSLDYISAWKLPGTDETDPSNYFEIGEYLPGSSAYHDTDFGTTNIQKLRLWYCWALNAAPSAYFQRGGTGLTYKDPLWNSPNGELWIYDYDPWEVLAA
jgi:hypothetical protein